jgi:sodium-dependent dicarboxylate transporter 2/3/5
MLPILIALQKELNIDPLLLMVPATLAASLGFMLPVATAPNTIVFGSRKIDVGDMARAGFLLNVSGILIISLLYLFFR